MMKYLVISLSAFVSESEARFLHRKQQLKKHLIKESKHGYSQRFINIVVVS
jgi:hypothetical protein